MASFPLTGRAAFGLPALPLGTWISEPLVQVFSAPVHFAVFLKERVDSAGRELATLFAKPARFTALPVFLPSYDMPPSSQDAALVFPPPGAAARAATQPDSQKSYGAAQLKNTEHSSGVEAGIVSAPPTQASKGKGDKDRWRQRYLIMKSSLIRRL